MARGKGNNDWEKLILALLGLAGLGALIYAQTGKGQDNAPLIPDEFERQIDDAVAALNQRFGKQWVDWSINIVQSYLRSILPPHLVRLADIIIQVELLSRQAQMAGQGKMSGYAKKQEALRRMGIK